jgi:protoporphyrinogen oxidase
MVVILGAGLAGLSSSYHMNHKCLIFEKKDHCGGHIFSQEINGFVWDEGPHISFTKHQYIKDLFYKSVEGKLLEFPVSPTNYYKGHWIPHPAQVNLHAIPEPMRSSCLNDFLSSREKKNDPPVNYKEWLQMAFGDKFTEEFPGKYTIKYWTTEAENLTTDWVGERVFYPKVEDVKSGFYKEQGSSSHYITTVRYPKTGGYFSFADLLKKDAVIKYNSEVIKVDLENKKLEFADGTIQEYSTLINTIPLPEFIKKTNAPSEIQVAAEQLSCSELLLINLVVDHDCLINSHWLYVYDLEKYSTRINFTNLLSPENGVNGKCGIQIEVYFSKYRLQTESLSFIVDKVCNEMVEMGLVKSIDSIEEVNTKKIKYANVIFDHSRKKALDKIFNYLSNYGLKRESDDLDPMTDWDVKLKEKEQFGNLIMAGRFGQWKYYWTDDCTLRGLYISENL